MKPQTSVSAQAPSAESPKPASQKRQKRLFSCILPRMQKIITVNDPESDVLLRKTDPIGPNEFSSVKEIEHKLYEALKPYFPAAGLAAPQIGILKSVFLFSYDRDPAHLEAVVNPSFTPIGDDLTVGWEGCLSVINACYKI